MFPFIPNNCQINPTANINPNVSNLVNPNLQITDPLISLRLQLLQQAQQASSIPLNNSLVSGIGINQVQTSLSNPPVTDQLTSLYNMQTNLNLINALKAQTLVSANQASSLNAVGIEGGSHTIQKAPVLYGKNAKNGGKSDELSPPDRIVAKYAEAAHANALATKRPLETAAEAFLSTAANSATHHAKMKAAKRQQMRLALTPQSISTSASSTEATQSNEINKSTLSKTEAVTSTTIINKPMLVGWSRVVDKNIPEVIYVSPEGSQIRTMSELRSNLINKNPKMAEELDDTLLSACFCFDHSRMTSSLPTPSDAYSKAMLHRQNEAKLNHILAASGAVVKTKEENSPSVSETEINGKSVSQCRISFNNNRKTAGIEEAEKDKVTDEPEATTDDEKTANSPKRPKMEEIELEKPSTVTENKDIIIAEEKHNDEKIITEPTSSNTHFSSLPQSVLKTTETKLSGETCTVSSSNCEQPIVASKVDSNASNQEHAIPASISSVNDQVLKTSAPSNQGRLPTSVINNVASSVNPIIQQTLRNQQQYVAPDVQLLLQQQALLVQQHQQRALYQQLLANGMQQNTLNDQIKQNMLANRALDVNSQVAASAAANTWQQQVASLLIQQQQQKQAQVQQSQQQALQQRQALALQMLQQQQLQRNLANHFHGNN